MADEWLAAPLLWFGAMALAGWLVYAWSGRVAPRFRPTGGKAKAYTGGEDLPGQAYRPGYAFFHVALLFTILHVAAIVLATAPRGAIPWAALAYLLVVGLSVPVLRWTR
ncbi:MAG TPA: hypothetical protein VJ326_07990 [Thermoplasmata archaeon]|nr:hypothetical protein [Thermoplasmata archaeon]